MLQRLRGCLAMRESTRGAMATCACAGPDSELLWESSVYVGPLRHQTLLDLQCLSTAFCLKSVSLLKCAGGMRWTPDTKTFVLELEKLTAVRHGAVHLERQHLGG